MDYSCNTPNLRDSLKIKTLLFPNDREIKRVVQFQRWRHLVQSEPKRFRIQMLRLPTHPGYVGGVVFVLEELIFSTSHIKELVQKNTKSNEVSFAPEVIKKSPAEDWTIVDFTELWIQD